MSKPLVSFVSGSYNYAHYISLLIKDILAQTVQDFEIVIVDDASKDNSVEVIRSFGDPRIKLHINDQNVGGAATYNRLISLAQGEFIATIDADDGAEPNKLERQLEAFRRNPKLGISGTYSKVIDGEGNPHPDPVMESYSNRVIDLNNVDSWIVRNPLCHSSVLLRASIHRDLGGFDVGMRHACDYEFWMRALRAGVRYEVLPEKLCKYRWHGSNVTHANPPLMFLELAYIMVKNVIPTLEERGQYGSLRSLLDWFNQHEQFARLKPKQRYKLFGSFFMPTGVKDFVEFRDFVLEDRPGDLAFASAGRKMFAIYFEHPYRLEDQAGWRLNLLNKRLEEEERKQSPLLYRLRRLPGSSRGFRYEFTRGRQLVMSSGLFDAEWYRKQYKEVSAAADALGHFMRTGWRKGYSPGPEFDTQWYLANNPDVAKSRSNPVVHYIRHGIKEGRLPKAPVAEPWREAELASEKKSR